MGTSYNAADKNQIGISDRDLGLTLLSDGRL
jgi:hypothetical protein